MAGIVGRRGWVSVVRNGVLGGNGLVCGGHGVVGVVPRASPWMEQGQQVRWANLKAVRARMRSVGSISKITNAMKVVASTKLRVVQRMYDRAGPFSVGMGHFFDRLGEAAEKTVEETSAGPEGVKTKEAIVAITSDRGLCGGVNSAIVKLVKRNVEAHSDRIDATIFLVGDKGKDGLSRVVGKLFAASYKDVFKSPVTFDLASIIAEEISSRSFDTIAICYNKFKSVISQIPTKKNIAGLEFMKANAHLFDEYEFDTDIDNNQVLMDLFEFQLAAQIFGACLENSTSEQAARMAAMDNATRNAKDMLSRLTLLYNRQRQAVITSELIEIISGAEALQG